jgi:hypothetical protein
MLNRYNYKNCIKYPKDDLFRICKIYKLKFSLSFTKIKLCQLLTDYFSKLENIPPSYLDAIYDNDIVSLKKFYHDGYLRLLDEQKKALFLSIELGYKDILLYFIKDLSFNTSDIQLSHLVDSVKSGNYEIISILQDILQPKLLLIEDIIKNFLTLNNKQIDDDMYINSQNSSNLLAVFAEYYKQLQFDF